MLRIAPLADDQTAFEIDRAAAESDTPDIPLGTFEAYRARLRHPWPGNELEQYLAVHDGVPAGHLELGLPLLDNLANVNVQLFVHPEQRRRGIGRALFGHAVERTRALGRRHLIGPTTDDGAAFARAMGAAAGLVEVRSRLDLATAEPPDTPVAAGYRLVRWTNVAPAEFLDDLGYLESRLNADAPTGDLAWEAEKVDAARVRAAEEAIRVRRRTAFHTGAVHEDSGRLIAWTTIAGQDDTAWHAWQSITIVDPGHRGHGLGLTIKNQNLRYARSSRPGLRAIDTFNAATNDHMLRINRTMGFRAVDQWTQWQLTV
ncbi:GNAT family N-acetyltransferase [Actinoplanes sp. ATCC 53533]|uniref:GNAT family N-acetyltransferase n=1 Tax=Actinoplanes sp. ATCC 53533 TaxID=1288362 RepID=UPI000F7AEBB6|nr:GNAT family N-acetyltransferase [Actinoplanes sp. ATCC 53533]RSM46584.1 GNAT family N-acetyltransferase [Actinoplanes sp. ATCC 53533]